MITFTPGSGVPTSASVTFPDTFISCAYPTENRTVNWDNSKIFFLGFYFGK